MKVIYKGLKTAVKKSEEDFQEAKEHHKMVEWQIGRKMFSLYWTINVYIYNTLCHIHMNK